MLEDMQIHERPQCDHCINDALCYVHGVKLCGECVIKLNDRKRKTILEELKNG